MRLYILFTLALLQQAVSSMPRPYQPAIPKQQSTQTNQQKPNGTQGKPNLTSTVSKSNTAPNHANENAQTVAPDNKEQSVRVVSVPPITTTRDTPAFVVSIILAVIGILGIGVAVCTLIVFIRQTGHIARQAQSMRYQTTQLRIAADAAKASADALVASERAWVIIEEGFVHDVLGTQWFMRPKVKNLGKTIARIKRVSLGTSLVPWKDQIPEAPIYSASKSFDFILCPNQEVPVGEVTSIEILHEHLQAAMTRGAALYAFGIVEYLDLAERERVTAFMLIYDPPDNFVPYLSAPATYYQAT